MNFCQFNLTLFPIFNGVVDPYSVCGFTKLVNTGPVRIRFHNTNENVVVVVGVQVPGDGGDGRSAGLPG